MKDGKWRRLRGGSMIWMAVLLMALPPLLIGSTNILRYLQAKRALRLATDAACQAAVSSVDTQHLQQTGEVRILMDEGRARANAAFAQVLQQYAELLNGASLSVTPSGVDAVYCVGRAFYRPWSLPESWGGPQHIPPLHASAISQARSLVAP